MDETALVAGGVCEPESGVAHGSIAGLNSATVTSFQRPTNTVKASAVRPIRQTVTQACSQPLSKAPNKLARNA